MSHVKVDRQWIHVLRQLGAFGHIFILFYAKMETRILKSIWSCTASHQSFDKVHAERAAPRSQRTGSTTGEGEVFELREAPKGQNTPHPGKRPEPLEGGVRAASGDQRHAGVGYELVLDPVVPQMVE